MWVGEVQGGGRWRWRWWRWSHHGLQAGGVEEVGGQVVGEEVLVGRQIVDQI